ARPGSCSDIVSRNRIYPDKPDHSGKVMGNAPLRPFNLNPFSCSPQELPAITSTFHHTKDALDRWKSASIGFLPIWSCQLLSHEKGKGIGNRPHPRFLFFASMMGR